MKRTYHTARANHTPGPWIWHMKEGPPGRLQSAHGLVIGHTTYEGMWFGTYDTEKDAANARLIAAAPELLAALKDLISWIPETIALHTNAPAFALERARAAINIAEAS